MMLITPISEHDIPEPHRTTVPLRQAASAAGEMQKAKRPSMSAFRIDFGFHFV